MSGKFEGREPKLRSHVFDYGDVKKAEAFYRTTEEACQFIRTDFKRGEDVVQTLRAGKEGHLSSFPTNKPTDPLEEDYGIKMDIYKKQVAVYVDSLALYQDNLKKAYGVILGQCSPNLKNNLQAQSSRARM